MSGISGSTVDYRGELLDPSVRLAECSDCHSAVPWDSFQAHIRWHSRILYASPAVRTAVDTGTTEEKA